MLLAADHHAEQAQARELPAAEGEPHSA